MFLKRLLFPLFVGSAILISSQGVLAQSNRVTTSTASGVMPYSLYGGARENINLATGNLNLQIPLLSVPGRAGLDLNVGLTYDSKNNYLTYTYNEYTGQVFYSWQPEQRVPTVAQSGYGGWRINAPWLSYSIECDEGNGLYAYHTDFIVTLPDGSRHHFENKDNAYFYSNGCFFGSGGPAPSQDTPLDDSNDASFTRLDTGPSGTAIFRMKDGTRIYFYGLPTVAWLSNGPTSAKVVDPNGNYITYNFSSNPTPNRVLSISDSLGRVVTLNYSPTTGNLTDITYKDSSGTQRSITFGYNGNLSSITLPNGRSYGFQYYGNGELSKITYPTGGYTRYDYATYQAWHQLYLFSTSADFREVTAKYVCPKETGSCTAQEEQATTYTPTIQASYSNNSSTQVIDPLGNKTVHSFTYLVNAPDLLAGEAMAAPRELTRQVYEGMWTLKRTMQTEYTGTLDTSLPSRVTTTLETGQVSKVEWSYGTYTNLSNQQSPIDNVIEQRDYDYGNVARRKTKFTYLKVNPINGQNYESTAIFILNRKTKQEVFDWNGSTETLKAKTEWEYDSYTEGLTASGTVQHDSTYGTSYTKRGNVTATKVWRNTDGATLTTRNQYDDAGNIRKATDPLNHATTFSYTDSWANATCQPTGGSAKAYLTSVTNALNHVTTSTYNSCSGTVASTTDPNSQTTSFSYDLMNRLIQTNLPGGGQTTRTYNEASVPLSLTTTTKITASVNLVATVAVDGLGREVLSSLDSDPEGVTRTKTEYDALGHKKRTYNPTRCNPLETNCGESTWGYTEYVYDGLGRVTKVRPPDGTLNPDSNIVTTSFYGNAVVVTDQAGKQRRSFSDALGRLVQVDEPTDTSGALPIPSIPGTSGTGSVTISGTEQSYEEAGEPQCFWEWDPIMMDWVWNCYPGPVNTYWDYGGVSITVNGLTKSANYSQTSTAASIASALANAINGDSGYPVTASVNGTTINLTSKLTGVASNYSLSATSWTNDPTHFATPSFTATRSGPNLTGGTDGTPGQSAAPAAVTLYTYDVLDNLTCVVQKSTDTTPFSSCAASPATWRPRTYTYNSLSQLLTAYNPESGSNTYAYNNDGNLTTKTDARSIATTHAYDALHRLTGKTYSNGDPAISYFYDQTSYNGLTITNGKGRRTGMSDAAGLEAWTYGPLGQVLTDRRTTNSVTKDFAYQYNLDGSVWKITYPTGRTIEYQPNAAGGTDWAKDVTNSINYAVAASYAPSGALRSVVHGQGAGFNGYNLIQTFNNRLQPSTVVATSPSSILLDFTYDFVDANGKNNGNVDAILNNRNHNRDFSYTYDELNRIKTAQSAATSGGDCWGLQYGFDIWANLLSATVTKCSETQLSQSVTTSNRLTGHSYDAAGNVTNDGSFSYTWDAESRMKSGAGVNYTYDGDGRRAKKSNGKLYWYGAGAEPLAESDLSGNISEEYIFFGGERIARRVVSPSSVFYYFADHLGTSRVIVQANATTACYEADFTPYGKERVITDTCPQNYKFTGKERDTESTLDYFGARLYSWGFGRFHSPDLPFIDQHLGNPQSWNLYAYARNNPLIFNDPTGNEAAPTGSDGIMWSPHWNVMTGWGPFLQGSSNDTVSYGYAYLFAVIASYYGLTTTTSANVQQATQQQPTSGEGSQANLDRRAAIAAAALADDGDTSMPYTPGRPTCNLFVQRDVAKSGAPKPEVPKADGTRGAPGAAEWAGSKIPGWRFLKPGEMPKPGDVAAYKLPGHADYTGHSGIVTFVDQNGTVHAIAAHPTVIGPDLSFQPKVATYRRYTGQ